MFGFLWRSGIGWDALDVSTLLACFWLAGRWYGRMSRVRVEARDVRERR